MSRKIVAPYYPLYPQDFVHSCRTAMMTAEEVGALFMVMCQQWETMGPIAHDPARFAAYTGWDQRIAKRLLTRLETIKKIDRDERGLFSSRMENEITKYVVKVRSSEIREAKKRESSSKDTGLATPLATPVATPVAVSTSTGDLFKKTSDFNESATRDGPLLDSDSDSERKNTPLAPQNGGHGGAAPQLELRVEAKDETTTQTRRRLAKQAREKSAAEKREAAEMLRSQIEVIVATYNAEADKRGFCQCEVLTAKRLEQIAQRINEVGGIDRVVLGIESAHLDDYLAGRVKPRDGGKPFRLTIDNLFSTGSGLGDVLVRCIELGAAKTKGRKPLAAGAHDPNWWRDPERVAAVTDSQWRGSITKHANGVWPVDRLGPPPGHAKCVAPKHIIDELGLTHTYDPRTGESREPH